MVAKIAPKIGAIWSPKTFESQPTMGTDIKKSYIPGIGLNITNLSEKKNSGLGVQQENSQY